MNAKVYREMKPHPTRCAVGAPNSEAASAAFRYFNRYPKAVGANCWAVGTLSSGVQL
ncbi:MAG: hypothetical protein M3170_05710 [Candidatus Dormibacteraeota bacterium]|nr:hypothetical protein [Candidatus Dormibacteraeota bacterium]